MKILHVIPSISLRRGGPSTATLNMVKGLNRAGYLTHLATTDDDGPGRHLPTQLGQLIVDDGAPTWFFRRQTNFYAFSWPLTQWLKDHVTDYDLLHIHALFSYATLPAAFWAYRKNIPYVIQPEGMLGQWGMENRRSSLKKLSFSIIERPLLERAKAIHYTCVAEQQQAEPLNIAQRTTSIPLGVELSTFENLPEPQRFLDVYPELAGKMIILFLSRLDPIKGLDMLLPAFAEAKRVEPDLALVVAGSGEPGFARLLQRQADSSP